MACEAQYALKATTAAFRATTQAALDTAQLLNEQAIAADEAAGELLQNCLNDPGPP